MNAGILPIKSHERAKRRLAGDMNELFHERVIEALVTDALELCASTPALAWWVVTDDEPARTRASEKTLETVIDLGAGLNEALQAGIQAAALAGAGSVTIVPADVPLARAEDIQDILDTGETSDVVVVPSSDGGTNGLHLTLPTEMEPMFGPGSLKAHVDQAESLDLRCSILDLPRLALDLDTDEDARLILEAGSGASRTEEVLKELLG